MAAWLLATLVAGAGVYCLLVVIACWHYKRVPPAQHAFWEPVSVLKPLAGIDEGLEENLRSFFTQDYPEYEILAAVRDPDDPAIEVFEKLQREFPHVPASLIVTGPPPYPNAKVYSLHMMVQAARYDLLVISDSDIRAEPNLLRQLVAEFQAGDLAVTTVPYRAVPGRSFWSRLEALGMNTHFWAGVLVARLIEGMQFTVGPTSAVRRRALEQLGGFESFREYLAEDFVLGKRAAERGMKVGLSRHVVEHRIGSQDFRANMRHRLRWARSTRRSRPAGYWGELFTFPLPLALLLLGVEPSWWPLALTAVAGRLIASVSVAGWVLRDRWTLERLHLLPLEDCLAFLTWLLGFFGNEIEWRGRRYRLHPDGRFELIPKPASPNPQARA